MGVMSQLLILFAALVVGWLLKSFMPSYLSQKGKNLATKEDIAEITAKIEGVKTDLRKGAFEHEVRFSKLHERRAEVLAEIYKRLVVTTWHVTNLGSAFQFVGT